MYDKTLHVTDAHIRAAAERIQDVLCPSPMIRAWDMEECLRCKLWFKAELFQRTGSFKVRGALNWMRTARPEELKPGLVTVSAGNHARALAWAAKQAGVPLTVVMPADASPIKTAATRALGADVILHGDINQAITKMQELKKQKGLTLVHPFDDPRIIAGQGTVGLEIIEQLPDVDVVVCPVGGGGLISGMATAIKSQKLHVRIYGVEAAGAPTLRTAWDKGGPTRLEQVRTHAPSLGAALAGEHTYRLSRTYVDDIIVLPEDRVGDAFRRVLQEGRLQAEPGAAVAVGALLQKLVPVDDNERVAAVITGGNVDPGVMQKWLQ